MAGGLTVPGAAPGGAPWHPHIRDSPHPGKLPLLTPVVAELSHAPPEDAVTDI